MSDRRAGAVATLAAVVGLLSGCGSASSSTGTSQRPTDALEVITKAAAASSNVRSLHMTATMSESMHGVAVGGQPPVSLDFSADMDGVLAMKPLRGRITMSRLTTNGHTFSGVTELITPTAFYLHMPQLQASTGKPWAAMRFEEMKAASGFDFKQLMAQAEQLQPGQFIKQLEKAGDVHAAGSETVRGVPTTHFTGTVPLADTLDQYSGSVRTQMASVMQAMGTKTTTVDIWLDDRGLLRRAKTSAHGDKATVTMSMDVIAYNVPVDVTPPPAGQTVDLAHLH